ncbi:transposase [Leifsonia sp. NPDC014704]|uniref:transposase n=1 Tax=Leifsonia TaxID=110932 RepID=UPI0036F473F5
MPAPDGKRGRRFRDHRTVVEGIIYRYRYRAGIAWRDLPPEFGPVLLRDLRRVPR